MLAAECVIQQRNLILRFECHWWGSLGNSEKEKYIRGKEKTLFLGVVWRIIIGRMEDIDDRYG